MPDPPINITPGLDGLAYVYFAITGCGRYMKIGGTFKPRTRIMGLRSDARKYFGRRATVQYIGLVLANSSYETTLHHHFSEYRVRAHGNGDWYRSSIEMMAYIRDISESFVSLDARATA